MELNTHSPPRLSYDKYDYESDSDMDPFEDRDGNHFTILNHSESVDHQNSTRKTLK